MKTCHLSKFLLLLYIIIIWSHFASQFELVIEFLCFENFINNIDIIHSSCHSAQLLVYLEIKINFAWNAPHNHTSVSIFYSLSFLISPFSFFVSLPTQDKKILHEFSYFYSSYTGAHEAQIKLSITFFHT